MNDLNLIAPKNADIAHRFVKNEDGSYCHYEQGLRTGLRNLLDVAMTHQEVVGMADRLIAYGWRLQS